METLEFVLALSFVFALGIVLNLIDYASEKRRKKDRQKRRDQS